MSNNNPFINYLNNNPINANPFNNLNYNNMQNYDFNNINRQQSLMTDYKSNSISNSLLQALSNNTQFIDNNDNISKLNMNNNSQKKDIFKFNKNNKIKDSNIKSNIDVFIEGEKSDPYKNLQLKRKQNLNNFIMNYRLNKDKNKDKDKDKVKNNIIKRLKNLNHIHHEDNSKKQIEINQGI